MAEEIASFQRTQYAFAAYIRDPYRNPPPRGPAPERMNVYRELFFNNIENFLATGFPVLKSILSKTHWLELVQDFYARHQSKTPYFAEIAEEFLDYLQNERGRHADDPPYLPELAHYEWAELALLIAEGEAPPESGDLIDRPLDQTIYLSELAWPLAYQFPVHKIGPGQLPTELSKQPTFLIIYRNRQDMVKFIEINSVTHRLLQMIEENRTRPAADCLISIAKEIGYVDSQAFAGFSAEVLCALAERGIIGAR